MTQTAVPAPSPTRRTALIAGAAAVAVVATLVILVWGLVPLPDYPSLTETPDASIPGLIAALESERGAEAHCVTVAAASGGEARVLTCFDGREDRWPDQLAWTAEGELVVTIYGRFGPAFEVLDPDTGEVLRTGTWDDGGPVERPFEPGAEPYGDADIRTRHAEGRFLVEVGPRSDPVVVLDVEAPRSYDAWERGWAPDGSHLWLVDSEQRLLIVRSDGSGTAGVVLDDVRSPTWWIEGVGADRVLELP